MAHQDLNGAEISTSLEQMSSKAMKPSCCAIPRSNNFPCC